MIERFQGNPESVRTKLNQLVDAVNQLLNIRVDKYIKREMTAGGLVLQLNMNALRSALTRAGMLGMGGTVVRMKITSVTGSFPVWTYTARVITGYDSSQTGADRWVVDTSSDAAEYTILNRMEFAPSSGYPYVYGNGVEISDSDGTVGSTSCVIVPIGVGAVVDVTVDMDLSDDSEDNGTPIYYFAQANSAETP